MGGLNKSIVPLSEILRDYNHMVALAYVGDFDKDGGSKLRFVAPSFLWRSKKGRLCLKVHQKSGHSHTNINNGYKTLHVDNIMYYKSYRTGQEYGERPTNLSKSAIKMLDYMDSMFMRDDNNMNQQNVLPNPSPKNNIGVREPNQQPDNSNMSAKDNIEKHIADKGVQRTDNINNNDIEQTPSLDKRQKTNNVDSYAVISDEQMQDMISSFLQNTPITPQQKDEVEDEIKQELQDDPTVPTANELNKNNIQQKTNIPVISFGGLKQKIKDIFKKLTR